MLEPEAEGQTSNTAFLRSPSIDKQLLEEVLEEADSISVEMF